MNPRAVFANRIVVFGFVLLAALAALQLTSRTDRNSARFKGVAVSTWVRRALVEEPQFTNAGVVLRIGSPAVPYLIEGLKDKSHNPLMLRLEWIRWHLPASWQWEKSEPCAARHRNAMALLSQMGEKGQPAVPAIIRCLETCPDQHYVDGLECFEALAEIGRAATNAVPFLTKVARCNNSFHIRAAATEYFITDRTNLIVETVLRLAKNNPQEIVSTHELFWFRDDARLNQVFVPLFVQLLFDDRLSDVDRQGAVFELRSRGVESFAAIPFLLQACLSTGSTELRSDLVAAFAQILGLVTGKEESTSLQAIASKSHPNLRLETTSAPPE